MSIRLHTFLVSCVVVSNNTDKRRSYEVSSIDNETERYHVTTTGGLTTRRTDHPGRCCCCCGTNKQQVPSEPWSCMS